MMAPIWSQYSRANCLPDNCGCELVRLEQWLAQPSAFWSSLFHIIFAFILYYQVKEKSLALKLWFFCLILLALSSHFGHGSFLEFAMAMDFSGIVLVMSFFALFNFAQKKSISTPVLVFLLLIYQFLLCLIFYSLHKWFKVGICSVIFSVTILELIKTNGRDFLKEKNLKKALIWFGVAFVFFMLDEFKVMCDPESWLSGHSVWHLGTAVSLYYYGKARFRLN
jgi:hypothetical protein